MRVEFAHRLRECVFLASVLVILPAVASAGNKFRDAPPKQEQGATAEEQIGNSIVGRQEDEVESPSPR